MVKKSVDNFISNIIIPNIIIPTIIYNGTNNKLINGIFWKNIGSIVYALQRCPILPIKMNAIINANTFTTTINTSCFTSSINNVINVNKINKYKICITYDIIQITPIQSTIAQTVTSTQTTQSQPIIQSTGFVPRVSTSIVRLNKIKMPVNILSDTYNTNSNSSSYTNINIITTNITKNFLLSNSAEINFSQFYYNKDIIYRNILIEDVNIIINDMLNIILQDGLSNGQSMNTFTTQDFIDNNYNNLSKILKLASIVIGSCKESYLLVQDPINMTLNIYVKRTNTVSTIIDKLNIDGTFTVLEGNIPVIIINIDSSSIVGSGSG